MVWLLWVLGVQSGIKGLTAVLAALLVAGMAAWIWGRASHGAARTLAWLLILGALAVVWKSVGSQEKSGLSIAWEPFSHQRVQELRKSGRIVFVDFTAAWCLSCQVNELNVFNNNKVQIKFQELGVAALKADWTSQDPVITEALRSFGRNSVPLYVIYSPDSKKPPRLLPEIITPGLVLEALEKLKK